MDIYDLTDEQIMAMSAPPAPAGGSTQTTVTTDTSAATVDTGADTTTTTTEDTTDNNDGDNGDGGDGSSTTATDETTTTTEVADGEVKAGQDAGTTTTDGGNVAANAGEQGGDAAKPVDGKPAGKQGTSEVAAEAKPTTPPDYKALYEASLAPLKANGKTFDIKSPDDLRQLAQQGLNYTQKMQQIAPIRKVGMMLQNHGLLDEQKLSFLIDLHNKKPEAIRQLIKDAGIDPLEIDVNSDTQYKQSNHAIADEEVNFRTVMSDLQGTTEGQNTLQVIDKTWDTASKEALWASPGIMQTVNEHRANGVYERVSTEVERQRALGNIPAGVSFLQAYQHLGTEMSKQGLLNDLVQPAVATTTQQEVQQKQPIATRTVVKKPEANAEKVASATQTKSGGKVETAKPNYLEMSDEDFNKELLKSRGYV